jgi:AbrB family looped-hinge helix DNA binding protein
MTTYYKTRLRQKGQITVPTEVREQLGAQEGDDLMFYTDEDGRIVVARAQIIPPDQAWFWTERWQNMEREAQADIEAGRVHAFENAEQAIQFLNRAAHEADNAKG